MKTTFRTSLHAAIYSLCGAAGLCALQTAAGAADDTLPTRKVSYADLDISKPAGAKVLYRRIEAAAQQVCISGASRDLRTAELQRACIDRAIEGAVQGVNSDALGDLRSAAVLNVASQH